MANFLQIKEEIMKKLFLLMIPLFMVFSDLQAAPIELHTDASTTQERSINTEFAAQNTNNNALWNQIATKWETGRSYTINDNLVVHGGDIYVCIEGHLSSSGTEPGTGATWSAAWEKIVGITAEQSANITTNLAKIGITPTQSANIITNLAKVGITTEQANAIIANTAKETNVTQVISIDSDQLTLSNGGGTITIPTGTGGSALTVQEEGSSLDAAVTVLNFIGAGITAVENADHTIDITVAAGSAPIDTVNGQTGTVVLDADDIDDASTTKKFTTSAEKGTWNAKQDALTNPVVLADTSAWDKDASDDFDGAYGSLSNPPTIPVSGTDFYSLTAADAAFQAADANMISWPSAISVTEVGYLDGLTGALSTSLATKATLTGTIVDNDFAEIGRAHV